MHQRYANFIVTETEMRLKFVRFLLFQVEDPSLFFKAIMSDQSGL